MMILPTLLTLAFFTPPLTIDGSFEEWGFTKKRKTQILDVKTTPQRIFILLELQKPTSLQNNSVPLTLWIDSDNSSATGDPKGLLSGADLKIIFSPETRRGKKAGNGASIQKYIEESANKKSYWSERSPSEINLAFAPTTQSDIFEIHASIPSEWEIESQASLQLAVGNNEANTPITFTLNLDKPNPPKEFNISNTSDLRAISWNGERGAFLKDQERTSRLLKSLKPQIILLQELTDKNTSEEVEQFLNTLNLGNWTVSCSSSSRLLSAVATNLPARKVQEFHSLVNKEITSPIRAAALDISYKNESILAVSVHLKCCGGPTGREENLRIKQAYLIKERLNNASKRLNLKGAIVGGDFNLVGTKKPLEILQGTEHNSSLLSPPMVQPDNIFCATWDREGSSFTPGRLDYILYSKTLGSLKKSFILDSRDLTPSELKKNQLKHSDTMKASDHLPIIIDINLKDQKE